MVVIKHIYLGIRLCCILPGESAPLHTVLHQIALGTFLLNQSGLHLHMLLNILHQPNCSMYNQLNKIRNDWINNVTKTCFLPLIFYIVSFYTLAINIPGHSWTLQLSVTVGAPTHSTPPCCASGAGALMFVRRPPPHVLSHSPMVQSLHTQSTTLKITKYNVKYNNQFNEDRNLQYYISLLGHGFVLHSSISLGCPVQVPPFASSTDFVLVLDLVPVPHESEHSPTTQSFHSQCIAKCM